MGFPQETAREALLHSNNDFDLATEYLLNAPGALAAAVPSSASNSDTGSRAVENEAPSNEGTTSTAAAAAAADGDAVIVAPTPSTLLGSATTATAAEVSIISYL